MRNEKWTIRKASNSAFEETRTIYNPGTFVAIIKELSEKYGCSIIIRYEEKIFWIYDDFIE